MIQSSLVDCSHFEHLRVQLRSNRTFRDFSVIEILSSYSLLITKGIYTRDLVSI